jgi:hypothetical protein
VLPKGTTFIRHGHIWFNLTEPKEKNRHVLCVNFTCLDDECTDDECPITRAEYDWVKDEYPTTIAFSRAQIWDADKIAKCLETRTLRKPRQGNVPATTVMKVYCVALLSRELSDDLRAFLLF